MWLFTEACMMITLLADLAIGSPVTSTDPVLSQAVAKGPSADTIRPQELARNHLGRGWR